MRRNLLRDEQWKRMEPHLPTDMRSKNRVNDRRVISGIVHILKSGCRLYDCTAARQFVRCARPSTSENLSVRFRGRADRRTHR